MQEAEGSAKREILVYADEGAGPMSTRALIRSLEHLCDPERVTIRRVTAKDIVPSQGDASLTVAGEPGDRYLTFADGPPEWTQSAIAICFPGGADRPWTRQLNGVGNLAIRHFVEQGGTYLGFCAGAYYACERFTFEADHPDPALRITATRELALFHGSAVGSLRELAVPYVVDRLECTTTVPVQWLDPPLRNPFAEVDPGGEGSRGDRLSRMMEAQDAGLGPVPVLYWGGPCFVPDPESSAEVLARYEGLPAHHAVAAVRSRIGQGTVVLSGAHIEVGVDDYEVEGRLDAYAAERTRDDNPQQGRFEHNVATLRASEARRLRLFRRLLEAAGLGRYLRSAVAISG